jgi:ribosomal protein S18 acetylase RimI-like enzyme
MTIENSESSPSATEALFRERYAVGVHSGGDALWDKYGEMALDIYRESFSPIVRASEGWPADSALTLLQLGIEDRIGRPDTTFVALTEKASDRIVGFTYAIPADAKLNTVYEKIEYEAFGISLAEYQARQNRTTFVDATIIRPAHRSPGQWSHMMDALETSLKNSGDYDEVTRTAREENKYAQKLRSRYQGRIVTDFPHIPSPIGPLTYFRIKL